MDQQDGQMLHAICTKFFHVIYIEFWKEVNILSYHSIWNILVNSDAVTLNISNKKNGCTGQSLYHETNGPKGAVAALSRRVHHILIIGGSESNLICNVFDNKQWTSFQIPHIVAAAIVASKYLNFQSQIIDPYLIGTHSLQTRSTLDLKLMIFVDSNIRMIGRWT